MSCADQKLSTLKEKDGCQLRTFIIRSDPRHIKHSLSKPKLSYFQTLLRSFTDGPAFTPIPLGRPDAAF